MQYLVGDYLAVLHPGHDVGVPPSVLVPLPLDINHLTTLKLHGGRWSVSRTGFFSVLPDFSDFGVRDGEILACVLIPSEVHLAC